jgi:hypothetical protein
MKMAVQVGGKASCRIELSEWQSPIKADLLKLEHPAYLPPIKYEFIALELYVGCTTVYDLRKYSYNYAMLHLQVFSSMRRTDTTYLFVLTGISATSSAV